MKEKNEKQNMLPAEGRRPALVLGGAQERVLREAPGAAPAPQVPHPALAPLPAQQKPALVPHLLLEVVCTWLWLWLCPRRWHQI